MLHVGDRRRMDSCNGIHCPENAHHRDVAQEEGASISLAGTSSHLLPQEIDADNPECEHDTIRNSTDGH